jgi:hypothetical protein
MDNAELQNQYRMDHNVRITMGEGNGESGRLSHTLSNVLADRTGHERRWPRSLLSIETSSMTLPAE